jgi:hypothetical protein
LNELLLEEPPNWTAGQRRAFSRLALAKPPVGPMTTTFEYSNNGYIVESTSGVVAAAVTNDGYFPKCLPEVGRTLLEAIAAA